MIEDFEEDYFDEIEEDDDIQFGFGFGEIAEEDYYDDWEEEDYSYDDSSLRYEDDSYLYYLEGDC